jgi:hypothetical protein
MRPWIVPLVLAGLAAAAAEVRLPNDEKSVRFAVIGDSGTGGSGQREVGAQMAKFRGEFPFEFVLMLGDNIYGRESASNMRRNFEEPYKPLLDSGVKFYAALGNHDNPNQRFYKPFNMDEKRYYSMKKGNAEFFALDSTYMTPEQLDWIKQRLAGSTAAWKICFFHHPIYSNGRRHGPDRDLRAQLEPIFRKEGVQLVLAGHEHFYERMHPQDGIFHIILGNSGKLRKGNIRQAQNSAKGFDTDLAFMGIEISGDQLFFQVVSRTGQTVDSGVIDRKTRVYSALPTATAAAAAGGVR